ncbi:MAG: YkvA family protein [Ectobacillus sp.]
MKKLWRRMRFIFNIRKSLPFLKEFFLSEDVSRKKKAIAVALLIGYIAFPFDLIPDFLVFFGIVDDVMILTLLLQQIVKMAPSSLKNKYDM